MASIHSFARFGLVIVGALLAALIALGMVWGIPTYTPLNLTSVLLVVVAIVVGVLVASRVAGRIFPGYDVAEVEVDSRITRDSRPGPLPMGGVGVSANDIVEQIERADADRHAKGLIVTLNTPGGEVVPSEDIRQAIEDFDGPTVAYAEDTAASGGFWIASGADTIHARRGAIVGSIGVNAVQLGRDELRQKLGLEYRRFVSGEYKDTPSAWRELGENEIEYFQGLLDAYYAQFVETVAQGTDLDPDVIEETEARVYLGETAADQGLVDYSGPRAEMETRLAEDLGVDEISVQQFEPSRRPSVRLRMGAQAIAHAFGAGLASAFGSGEESLIRV